MCAGQQGRACGSTDWTWPLLAAGHPQERVAQRWKWAILPKPRCPLESSLLARSGTSPNTAHKVLARRARGHLGHAAGRVTWKSGN